MPKFEKKYVHFMWDDELEGKEGFFSDDIISLQIDVGHDVRTWYGRAYSNATSPYQFSYDDEHAFRFFYHDPHYELKLAHEQGKTIQCRVSGKWDDLHEPIWSGEPERYRIKPEEEKPVTNRELARWLAQGNGEFYRVDDSGWKTACRIEWEYTPENESKYVCDVMVRKWDDDEWHKPTRRYMGLEDDDE